MNLENIGFYTLSDKRAKEVNFETDLHLLSQSDNCFACKIC